MSFETLVVSGSSLEVIHPDPSEIDPALQPVPRQLQDKNGPNEVRCNWCPPGTRTYKLSGIKRHCRARHPGKEVSYTRLQANDDDAQDRADAPADGERKEEEKSEERVEKERGVGRGSKRSSGVLSSSEDDHDEFG